MEDFAAKLKQYEKTLKGLKQKTTQLSKAAKDAKKENWDNHKELVHAAKRGAEKQGFRTLKAGFFFT